MRILVNFATRSRPRKFLKCLNNLHELAAGPFQVLVKADLDDESMQGIEVPYDNVTMAWGKSDSKIHAINRDIPVDGWDILVNLSDDQLFVKKGWDKIIIDAFDKHGTDILAHFLDQCPYRERLVSMSIIGNEYYKRFGYVYNPEYISLWSDNEAKDVAEKLGRYRYFGGERHDFILFNHLHPAWEKGYEADDQLRKTESFYSIDEQTYNRRKARNFDL